MFINPDGKAVIRITQTVQPYASGDLVALDPELAAKYLAKDYAVAPTEEELNESGVLERYYRRRNAQIARRAKAEAAAEAKAIRDEKTIADYKAKKKAEAPAPSKSKAAEAEAEAEAAATSTRRRRRSSSSSSSSDDKA